MKKIVAFRLGLLFFYFLQIVLLLLLLLQGRYRFVFSEKVKVVTSERSWALDHDLVASSPL